MASDDSRNSFIPVVFKDPKSIKILEPTETVSSQAKKDNKNEGTQSEQAEVKTPEVFTSPNISEKTSAFADEVEIDPPDDPYIYQKVISTFSGEEISIDEIEDSLQKTPPEPPTCGLSRYEYFSDIIPDPYRPFEQLPDKEEELKTHPAFRWIRHQKRKTQSYLYAAGEKEELIKLLKEKFEDTPDYKNFLSRKNDRGGWIWIEDKKHHVTHLGPYRFEIKDFEQDKEIKFIRTNLKTGETDTLLKRDKNIGFASNKILSIYINPFDFRFLLECGIEGKYTGRQYFLFNQNGEMIKALDVPDSFQFATWHPKNLGFYYSTYPNNEIYSPKRIYFFHSFEKDAPIIEVFSEIASEKESDKEPFIIFRNDIHTGMLRVLDVSFFRKYENEYREYLFDDKCPSKLVEISKKQSLKDHYIWASDETFIYSLKMNLYYYYDVYKTPLDNIDNKEPQKILSKLDLHRNTDIAHVSGYILAIEQKNLSHTLNIYTVDGKNVFSFEPDIPSSLSLGDFWYEKKTIEVYVETFSAPLKIFDLNLEILSIEDITPEEFQNIGSDIVTTQEFAASYDGTLIPLTLIHHKDITLNIETSTILHGYGGFGVCEAPQWNILQTHWIMSGGVYAIAHVRGGGGWKEKWCEDGSLLNKPNSFADFNACAEHLINTGKTSSNKLVSYGYSNGGLLTISAMQKRPDLYGGVISIAAPLDMFKNNYSNLYTRTNYRLYGIPDIEEHYDVMKSYSPLHNIDDNKRYPPCFIAALAEDERVYPSHALKFVATMQDRIKDSHCYLYWKDKGLHSDMFGKSGEADFDAYADVLTFAAQETGLNLFNQIGKMNE